MHLLAQQRTLATTYIVCLQVLLASLQGLILLSGLALVLGITLRDPLPDRMTKQESRWLRKQHDDMGAGDERPSLGDDVFTLTRSWFGADIIILGVLLVAHNTAALPLFLRLRRASHEGRTWTVRRRHIVRETVAKSAALNMMMLSALTPAITFLVAPRFLCEDSAGMQVMFFLVWEVRHAVLLVATRTSLGHGTSIAVFSLRMR